MEIAHKFVRICPSMRTNTPAERRPQLFAIKKSPGLSCERDARHRQVARVQENAYLYPGAQGSSVISSSMRGCFGSLLNRTR